MNRPFTSLVKKILNLRGGQPQAFLVFQWHPESSDAPLVAVTRTEFNARAIEKQQLSVRPTYRVTWRRFTIPDATAVGDGAGLLPQKNLLSARAVSSGAGAKRQTSHNQLRPGAGSSQPLSIQGEATNQVQLEIYL